MKNHLLSEAIGDIAGMPYAFYKEMPQELIDNAKAKLPEWMLKVSEQLDAYVNKV